MMTGISGLEIPDPAQDFVAVDPRKPVIQKNQIRIFPGKEIQTFFARSAGEDFISGMGQGNLEGVPEGGFIVDDQNFEVHCLCFPGEGGW